MPPQGTVKDRSADCQAFTIRWMLNAVHIFGGMGQGYPGILDIGPRFIYCLADAQCGTYYYGPVYWLQQENRRPGIVSGVFRIWKMQVRQVHGAGP
jgi:hypothetical protein